MYLDPTRTAVPVNRGLQLGDINDIASVAAAVHVDERIGRYIVQLVAATRKPAEFKLPSLVPHIAFGASPRATLALAHVAKGYAFIQGRAYVIPEDVKAIAPDVLRHRLVLTYDALGDGVKPDDVLGRILETVGGNVRRSGWTSVTEELPA